MSYQSINQQSPNGFSKEERSETEVTPKAKRRRFSAKYKLRILKEADECNEAGQLGALLRREGLYSSNLRTWRRQREDGILGGLAPRKRGPKPSPDAKRIRELQRENERLKEHLRKAEIIIDVQKKFRYY